MTPTLLSLILDFVVLLALAGTIYYAMRLSSALNNFKAHREELTGLLGELSSHVDQAQNAIISLKRTSDTAASDLDDILHDSRRMAEELKMINETGDALASRLEKAAQQSRAPVSSGFDEMDVMDDEMIDEAPVLPRRDVDAPPSFFIKDTDFEDEETPVSAGNDQGGFASQAEKELYDALQKNKKQGGGQR